MPKIQSRILLKIFLLAVTVNLLYILAYIPFTVANSESGIHNKEESGKLLFKSNCSGCHLNGKNLIKPEKPIIGSSKIKSKKIFGDFISSPVPPMPNFKNIAVNPHQLDALYTYVTSLMGK